MRTGGYTLQQSLTAEAATIAKQAVSLARRRGHAQVTPLHVATIMFASSTCLFRRACLQSHSHPLQSKALELCFNVALNRLQTSTSNPILLPPHSHHHHLPSLSNAMIAAFKRAQAHQRRGCAENHQQPILAVKIDIEQLVISILDDPSVSRVMREAGFSSTQVKAKVEQTAAAAAGIRSDKECNIIPKPLFLGNWASQTLPSTNHDFKFSIMKSSDQHAKNDDVMSVIEALTNKKTRNIVIVGECGVTSENVVRGVIEKFDHGNDVPKEMQSLQFISVPLYTLRNISKEGFEVKLQELRSLVKSLANRGVVLYLGDLRWICEFWWRYKEMSDGGYSPVEDMVMELSRLGRGFGGNMGKLWIIGTATFQTYMKCKNGCPSLESLWDLHPITIPVGSLTLGLNLGSDLKNNVRSKEAAEGSSRCRDCFNKEAQKSSQECDFITTCKTNSNLPAWLQKYKQEEIREITHHQEEENMKNLSWKWNTICKSIHQNSPFLEEQSINFSSATPTTSNDSKNNLQIFMNWESNFETNHSPKEQNFFELEDEPNIQSNPNSSPNSASSSEASGEIPEQPSRFNEQNQENFYILSSVLEKTIPWQRDAIHETVNTVLECRRCKKDRVDTWLCFTGQDSESKEKIARELAKVVFGSVENIITISLSSFSTEKSVDDEEVISNKRARNEEGTSYFERFQDKVKENPNRVFFMEDVEQIDYSSKRCFKKAMDSGCFRLCDGELVSLKDAIIIFSSDSLSSCGPRARRGPVVIHGNGNDDEERDFMDCEKAEDLNKTCYWLDLNVATYDCDDGDGEFLRFVDNVVVFNM